MLEVALAMFEFLGDPILAEDAGVLDHGSSFSIR
jgi:hypothetical protein